MNWKVLSAIAFAGRLDECDINVTGGTGIGTLEDFALETLPTHWHGGQRIEHE